MSNPTYEAVTGQGCRTLRTVPYPAGVGVTRQHLKRGKNSGMRAVPNNAEMVAWLDSSTPGWYSVMVGSHINKPSVRSIIFDTADHAALFKLWWT